MFCQLRRHDDNNDDNVGRSDLCSLQDICFYCVDNHDNDHVHNDDNNYKKKNSNEIPVGYDDKS